MVLKVSKRNSKRNKLLLLITILIILTIGLFFYLSYFRDTTKQKIENKKDNAQELNLNSATEEQKKTGDQIKSDKSSDTPPPPTEIDGSDKQNVQMNITSINKTESSLQIRTIISAVDNNGLCKLTMTNENKNKIEETVDVQPQASISTCKGFDLDLSKLNKGLWNIKIEYSSEKLTSSISKDYNIE